MAKKREEEQKKGLPEWQATYGDMVTLLLTFFVLLFSMSNVDSQKFASVMSLYTGTSGVLSGGESIVPSGIKAGNGVSQLPDFDAFVKKTGSEKKKLQDEELEEIEKEIKEYIKENNLEGIVEVEKKGDYVEMKFDNSVLFDSGKADLKPSAIEILNIIYDLLVVYKDNHIMVEGHTDNVPINDYKYPTNWELSGGRAFAVLRYFVENKGMDPKVISATGRGEYHPIDDNGTIEGRARNRRVEIKILSQY